MDAELARIWEFDNGELNWNELLQKRRCVILAEAGSGKSTEFEQQVKKLRSANRYVFYASVEEVGQVGLDRALTASDLDSLENWRRDYNDAWFFIDSVDEAKKASVKFGRAAKEIARSIHGVERRCHIFISSRVSDWEHKADLESLKQFLSVPPVITQQGGSPEEELRRVLDNGRQQPETINKNEVPFVAILAPLDRERVRSYAEAADTIGISAFLNALDDSDLWRFTRRPLDLEWLIESWNKDGRLGTLRETLDSCVSSRLKEIKPSLDQTNTFSIVEAEAAVERIGAAMVFGRVDSIAVPDQTELLAPQGSMKLCEALPDWGGTKLSRLLTTGLFDPATFGRVRLHNDNEGTVRGYLCARWLQRLRKAGLPIRRLFRLLFARSYDLEVLKPSLNETVAWLCTWDPDVAKETLRIAPSLLLINGDPASLREDFCISALEAALLELQQEPPTRPFWRNSQLKRFARTKIGSAVKSLWPRYERHAEATELLMRLIWLGSLRECVQIAESVAFDASRPEIVRVLAGRVVATIGSDATRRKYSEFVRREANQLPRSMLWDALAGLFPESLNVADFLKIVESMKISGPWGTSTFGIDGRTLVQKLNSASDLNELLVGLLGQLDSELAPHCHHPPGQREEALFPVMAEASLRLLKLSEAQDLPNAAMDSLLRIGNRRNHSRKLNETYIAALSELHNHPKRRQQAFWSVVDTLRRCFPDHRIERPWEIDHFGYPSGLQIEDAEWLVSDGVSRLELDCRLAFNAALGLYSHAGRPPAMMTTIQTFAKSNRIAQATISAYLNPPSDPSPEWLSLQQRRAEAEARNEESLKARDSSWKRFIAEVQSSPDRIEKIKAPQDKQSKSDLRELWRLLLGGNGRTRYSIESVAPLAKIVGWDVANAVEDGLIVSGQQSPS